MTDCRYLIDISPYPAICEHPCMLYGGGAVEAECEGCEWRTPRRSIEELETENAKLRELAWRLLTEYRYMRVRPRRVYLGHEERMRAIEEEMRELGIEANDD